MLADISPEYDECPSICFKGVSEDDKFCNGCEVKIAKDTFKETTIEELEDRFGSKWTSYGFDSLLETVIMIANSEDDDKSQWTCITESLFNIYLSQRNRLQRIEHWNTKQKLRAKE